MTPSHAQEMLANIKSNTPSAVRLRVVGSIDNPDADGPGAKLQHARRLAGLSVVQVAAALKLRPDQIAAIESMQFTRLPGLGYGLGYVRAYAELIDIGDVKSLVDDFKDAWAPHQKRHEATKKSFDTRRAIPFGVAITLLALAWIIFNALINSALPNRNAEIERPDAAIKVWAQSPSIATAPVVSVDPVISLHANRAVNISLYGEDGVLVLERSLRAGENIATDGLGRWFISTNDAGALDVRGLGYVIGLGENYTKLERFRAPDLAAMHAQKLADEQKGIAEKAAKEAAKNQARLQKK